MIYRPYPAYRVCGLDWIDRVPREWRIERLKWALSQKVTDGPHVTPVFVAEGIPFLSVDGIQDGELVFDGCRYVSPDDHEMFRKKVSPKRDDILMGKAASIGRIARVKVDFEFSVWSPLAVIRTKPNKLEARFAEYALKSSPTQYQIEQLCTSNTQKNISMDDIPQLVLCVPPEIDQAAIANFLDAKTSTIDAVIRKKERLIKVLQEKRQAVITRAVTKGLDPTVQMKESGLAGVGMVPQHWAIKRLKHVAEVRSGVTKGRDLGSRKTIELPYLRVANVQDGYLDLADIMYIPIGEDEVSSYSLKHGDVLMNEGGDFDKLGRGHVWEAEIEPCLHQNHVFAVRPRSIIDPYWLSAITSSDYAKQFFILRSKQTTNLASISSSNLKELPILLPSREEQVQILDHISRNCSRLELLIERVSSHVCMLREYRQTLVTAAVTGKIDVNFQEHVIPAAELTEEYA